MPSDLSAFPAIISWAMGFIALLILGIALPVTFSVLPDAIGLGRRRGEWRALLWLLGVVAGLILIGAYLLTLTGKGTSPSTALWVTIDVALFLMSITAAAMFTINRAVDRRRARRSALAAVMAASSLGTSGTDRAAAPARRESLSWREAEFLAADWMRHLGVDEVEVTRETADGGVDVRSRDYVAQVKNWQRDQIGVALVRQLHGVASSEGRLGLFFSTTTYTPEAMAYAGAVGMALFTMRPAEGRLVAIGPLAQRYRDQGLPVSERR